MTSGKQMQVMAMVMVPNMSIGKYIVVFQASFFRGEQLNFGYVSPHLSAIKRRFGKGTTNPIFRDENILTMVINQVTSTWKLEWLNFPCIVL